MSHVMRVRSGFTLIELLVVVTIIGILAAILFPVFMLARERARQTACLSNLKQLMTGFTLYKEDYGGTWAYTVAADTVTDGTRTVNAANWLSGVFPYVRDRNVFRCPCQAPAAACTMWSCQQQGDPWASGSGTTYGVNDFISRGTQDSMIRNPSETLFLADCRCNWIGDYTSESFPAKGRRGRVARAQRGAEKSPAACCGGGWDRLADKGTLHHGGSNLGFCDGHAKWFEGKKCRTLTGGGVLRYYAAEW